MQPLCIYCSLRYQPLKLRSTFDYCGIWPDLPKVTSMTHDTDCIYAVVQHCFMCIYRYYSYTRFSVSMCVAHYCFVVIYQIASCFVLVRALVGYHIFWQRGQSKLFAMAVHGTLVTFNPREEDWSEYAERLSIYFTTNGITGNTKKRAILLSSVGPPTFCLM